MKITTFNPQIVTKNAEGLIKLFEELGFERRHQQEGIGDMDVTGIRMKDSDGHYVDISEVDIGLKEDKVAIRMNVDENLWRWDLRMYTVIIRLIPKLQNQP